MGFLRQELCAKMGAQWQDHTRITETINSSWWQMAVGVTCRPWVCRVLTLLPFCKSSCFRYKALLQPAPSHLLNVCTPHYPLGLRPQIASLGISPWDFWLWFPSSQQCLPLARAKVRMLINGYWKNKSVNGLMSVDVCLPETSFPGLWVMRGER